MQNLKFILKPKSSIISDFQSDTIFGHICWAIKYLDGEDKLKEFLERHQIEPPLLLSSGFPRIRTNGKTIEFLPKPILRPLSLDEEETLFKNFYKDTKKEKVLFSSALKNLKKQKYVSLNAFEKIKDNLSYSELYKLVFDNEICPQNFIPKPAECRRNYYECPLLNYEVDIKNCPKKITITKTEEVYHNTKNRLTDRVEKEGGLFSTRNIFFSENVDIVIYIQKNNYFEEDNLKKVFEFISKNGFGADKSTGKGRFEIEVEKDFNLPKANNPNAFLTLSNYYPKNGDPTDGFYETVVKFGKLGGDWAKSKEKTWKTKNTFYKMPIIFIAPGGVFKTEEIKQYYGCLIPNVHIDERIVQYGYTISIGVKIK